MVYPFKCSKCGKEYEFNMSVDEYKNKKDKLYCNKCNIKLQRIYKIGIKTSDGFKN